MENGQDMVESDIHIAVPDIEQKRVFITSDTHFFHTNIIQYCNRPWATVEEMNEGLIERWNSVVGKEDTVIHLGDFGFGGKTRIKGIFDRLNGKIDLIMGNHDNFRVRDYYKMGFHRVYDKPILYKDFFLLSHEPVGWVKDGGVYANIYGHVHDLPHFKNFTQNTFCACVERTDYKPILFEDIVAKMKSCEENPL